MYFCFSIVNHDLFDSQEPMDENCYEQMKARPERSVNEPQEATPPARVSFVFYVRVKFRLDHSTAAGFKIMKAAHSDVHLKQPVRNFAA